MKIVLACLLLLLGFLFVSLLKIAPRNLVKNISSEPLTLPVIIVPISLSIERIGVSAPIELVGILDRAMAVPLLSGDVGWYSFGTKPGNVGSAVLAGHVNWLGGEDSVFTNLKFVQVGDIISVSDSGGFVTNFVVRKLVNYPVDTDTSEVFSSEDGRSHLNLITCSGLWDPLKKTHQSRLVVFSEKVAQ